MKKLLFVCNNLRYGGIPKSLVNLLHEIGGEYEIDLLLFWPFGDYVKDLPPGIKRLPSTGLLPLLGIPQEVLKQESRGKAFLRGLLVGFSRIFSNEIPRKIVFSTAPELTGYDAAISYAQDNSDQAFAVGCNAYVLQKVQAARKIAFIHCDFEKYGGNTKKNRASYVKYDRIACVSGGCREAFVRVMPEQSNKTYVVQNCTNYPEIEKRSHEEVEAFEPGCFYLISVSRITEEKGHLRALQVIEKLMKEYPALRWYIVGDGLCRPRLEDAIQVAGLTGKVVLLGVKDNPYPYMRRSDLLFLPSFHEAAPMVFDEAKALRLPILTTKTTSSMELVEEAGLGVVCENSEDGIEKGLRKVLEEPEILEGIRTRLKEVKLDNQIPKAQWEQLIRSKE